MEKNMNYYYYNQNNSDSPYNIYNISSSNNNFENNNYNNQDDLGLNVSQEQINSQEDIIQIKNEDEIENSGSGKYRFINIQAEKEDKMKSKNEFNNDKINYSSENINNKRNNNHSNKITNNICIIINKPEVKDINNNSNININYLDNYKEENQYMDNNNNNKNELNEKINLHKKNNSYVSNNKKSPNDYIEEIDNYYNYSYLEKEPNEDGKKITLHKKLNLKKQKLKDLEQKIKNTNISLKDKKSKVEKKRARSSTFDSGNNTKGKGNDLKVESITYDLPVYSIETKMPQIKNKNNKNSKNNKHNNNLKNNSEDLIFNDIQKINNQKHKNYDDEEEDYIYKTMSPDISRNKYNISFKKSIEQKRKLLGIPLYKNELKNDNTKIKDDIDNKEEKKQTNKLKIYKKRQDEILRNYEKKNIINQKSRDYIKNNKIKNRNPIRITYYDKNKKDMISNNIFENDNYINDEKNNNKKIDNENKNNIRFNKSYIIKKPDYNNKNKRNINSQKETDNFNEQNKTQNSINNKEDDTNYLRKKIKVYKEKTKENKNFMTRNNTNNNSKKIMEFKILPPNKIDLQKEKKIYENNSYYSKIISKLFNYNENDSQKNQYNNKNDNKNINNLNNNTKYNKTNNIINNNKDKFPYNTKILYSSQKNGEIMTIQNNENCKILRIVKKRHKTPDKTPIQIEANKKTIKALKTQKDQSRNEKKEYNKNITTPGGGISALRRINQRIENYKNRIPSKKRIKSKNKNQQNNSLS